jgi:hypothetical protein
MGCTFAPMQSPTKHLNAGNHPCTVPSVKSYLSCITRRWEFAPGCDVRRECITFTRLLYIMQRPTPEKSRKILKRQF